MWSCGLSTHKSQNQRPYGTPGPDLASRLMCELTRSKCELTRSNGHPNYGCDPSAWCPDLRSALTRVGLGALQPVPERSAVEPAADSVDARGRAGVLVGLDGCEVRLCLPCARVRPSVPCVSRLPPVSFYRYGTFLDPKFARRTFVKTSHAEDTPLAAAARAHARSMPATKGPERSPTRTSGLCSSVAQKALGRRSTWRSIKRRGRQCSRRR